MENEHNNAQCSANDFKGDNNPAPSLSKLDSILNRLSGLSKSNMVVSIYMSPEAIEENRKESERLHQVYLSNKNPNINNSIFDKNNK